MVIEDYHRVYYDFLKKDKEFLAETTDYKVKQLYSLQIHIYQHPPFVFPTFDEEDYQELNIEENQNQHNCHLSNEIHIYDYQE
jgi:hypothetical protein